MADSMFSRLMRIGVVLLALAQLGVWGIYAPAHRLLHHSHLRTAQAEPAATCHSRCCAHHSHPETSTPGTSQPPRHAPDQCPDDDQHCGLCVVALHAACAVDPVRLTNAIDRVEPYAPQVEIAVDRDSVRAFDGRGPPRGLKRDLQ